MEGLLQNKKLLIGAGVGLVLILIILVTIIFSALKGLAPTTITFWGLWESESVYTQIIADYKKTHPNVTVRYLKQSPLNYRERLVAAIAKSDGPDIFLIHNTWTPSLANSLAAMPTTVFTPATFKTTFYPIMVKDLSLSGKPVAVPTMVDTLAMYVNDDIFKAAGATAPKVWDGADGVLATARKLTVRDANNKIKTSGAALGTANNVDGWEDIVSLLMLQTGVDLSKNINSTEISQALDFYTSFAKTEKIWDETQDNSTLAFASGKVGMYFAPSWRFFDIKQINPNLNFHVVSVPQLTGAEATSFATYWSMAVSKNSKNQKAAWEFIQYLSSKDVMTKLYTVESKLRDFGEPYPRIDMASLVSSDPNVSVFVNQATTAKSWYLASRTRDGATGVNTKIAKYFEDAINSVVRGSTAQSVMDTVAKGVAQVLSGK